VNKRILQSLLFGALCVIGYLLQTVGELLQGYGDPLNVAEVCVSTFVSVSALTFGMLTLKKKLADMEVEGEP
jgi:hypothetical protein